MSPSLAYQVQHPEVYRATHGVAEINVMIIKMRKEIPENQRERDKENEIVSTIYTCFSPWNWHRGHRNNLQAINYCDICFLRPHKISNCIRFIYTWIFGPCLSTFLANVCANKFEFVLGNFPKYANKRFELKHFVGVKCDPKPRERERERES